MTSEVLSASRPAATAPFDRTALRVNQALIITLLALGFVADQPWLVVFVFAVMAVGTAFPKAALFQRLYRDILRPAGLLRPDLHAEDAAPHRFAQGMGAAVLLVASAALFAGAAVFGWGLAFVVIALAAINLIFGFCAGCFVYFQLQRLRH
ncbi:MAG: DUF4395 domain-containing protein [Roseiflexaceae bacterium]